MRLLRLAGTVALTVGLAGCWTAPGAGPDNSGYNPFEKGLTRANVATLAPDWTWEADFVAPNAVGSPIVTPGGVHAVAAHILVTVDPQTGEERWRRQLYDPEQAAQVPIGAGLDGFVLGELLVGVSVYRHLVPGDGTFSFDAVTGAPNGPLTRSGAVVPRDHRLVATYGDIVGSGVGISGLFVHDRADPTKDWAANLNVGAIDFGPSRPAVGQNGFFVTVASFLSAYPFTEPAGCTNPVPQVPSIRLCPPRWSKSLPSLLSAPVLTRDNDQVIVVDAAHVYGFDPATGTTLWTGALPAASPPPSPAATDGARAFVPYGDRLAVFDTGDCDPSPCAPEWTAAMGGTTGLQPVVAGGVVYTATNAGMLKAFPATGCGRATCAPLWEHDLGTQVFGGPAVSDGHLYVGTLDGRLVAFAPAA